MEAKRLYRARRRRNAAAMLLSVLAAAFGLGCLLLILATLVWHGAGGISPAVFTRMTPPPGAQGGLLNAIAGSLLMTTLGIAIGAPVGILAGTYMAEYGRGSKLTAAIRFVNDILLSAPSIVIGLFVLAPSQLVLAYLLGGTIALGAMRAAIARTAFRGTVTAAKQDSVVGPFTPGPTRTEPPIQYALF